MTPSADFNALLHLPNIAPSALVERRTRRRKGIGGHQRPNEGKSNVWLTPQWVISALGSFDLDPCAAPLPRPYPTAKHHITLPDDGFAAEWFGRVWLNPPYGMHVGKWAGRLADHGCGTALIFARTETEAWQEHIWPRASAILFPDKRITFVRPDGTPADYNGGAPSALVAYGAADVAALRCSGISGAFVSGVPTSVVLAVDPSWSTPKTNPE